MILGSDLRALRNLVRTAEGRKALLGNVVVVVCVAVGGYAMAAAVFGRGPIRDAVRQNLDGDVVRTLHAMLLLPPLLLVLGVGVSHFGGELYRANQVPMLLTAPVRAFALVWRAFARSLFGWWVFACAVAVPAAVRVADGLPWSGSVAVSVPVALLALLAPLLATQLLIKVALVRWCSGARLRWWFTVANAGLVVGLALAILLGFVRGDAVNAAIGGWLASSGNLPWLLEAPAALPVAMARFPQDAARYWATAALAASAVVPLSLAAACYRRSYDVHCSSSDATPVRVGRSRSWPESPFWSQLARTRAETVRVRSNLVFYAFLATVIVLILSRGTTQPDHESRLPLVLHEVLYLAGTWQGVVTVMATLLFLAVVGDEQQQIVVLACSPVPRRLWLHGKMVTVLVPFVVTIVVTALAGLLVAGVHGAAVLGYLALAPAVLLYDFGWILMLGTWPAFIRVHDDMPLAQNMRSVVPVVLIGFGCGAGMFLGVKGRAALVACHYGHGWFAGDDPTVATAWLLAGAWIVGLSAFAIGYGLARRNVERMLGPQPE